MKTISQSTAGLVIAVLVLQIRDIEGNGCKKMNWLSSKKGRYLHNHITQTLTTTSEVMCRATCYLSDSCLSHNFHESTGTCDINDSDEFQHPDDLIHKLGYVYRGTQNSCQSKPCPSNNTCQSNFTVEGGFKCLCPSGYTGSSCNTDVDECESGAHNCSIYSRCENTRGAFRCIPLDGSKENPAKSCLNVLKGGYSNGSGEYWLNLTNTSTPIQALCDMTTDGGGWTVVAKLVQPSNVTLLGAPLDTYEVIKEYHNMSENYFPTGAAMLDIQQKMGFHQIHFYCRKVSVGRVVSIMTKNNTAGQAVVSFFTNPKVATTFPTACDSFDRLPEDTSILAQNCSRWGGNAETGSPADTNQWGGNCCKGPARIAARPFQIVSPRKYGFEFSLYFSCDNDVPTFSNYSLKIPPDTDDKWQLAVR